jgi:AcrR family transcriptional regulator
MDAIARKAFVSRTAVYFYFPNKRAVVDRLIQHAFSEMYLAASPYLDGDGDPRKELRAGLGRVVSVVNRHARVLLLAAQLSGHRGEHLPEEWAPFITRFAERAEARIARDQEHGIAPNDISRGSRPRRCSRWSRTTSCASSCSAGATRRSRSACSPSCGGARCTRARAPRPA